MRSLRVLVVWAESHHKKWSLSVIRLNIDIFISFLFHHIFDYQMRFMANTINLTYFRSKIVNSTIHCISNSNVGHLDNKNESIFISHIHMNGPFFLSFFHIFFFLFGFCSLLIFILTFQISERYAFNTFTCCFWLLATWPPMHCYFHEIYW